MFAKLLKHEWRSTCGMLGILIIVCLGASLLGGATTGYLTYASSHEVAESKLADVLSISGMIAAMITIVVVGVAALVMYVDRFYKSRFTDEGYLTFTLPVNTHQNLLAALLNTAIGMVIMILIMGVSMGLWLAIAFLGVQGFYESLWKLLPRMWEYIGGRMNEIPWRALVGFCLNTLAGGICKLMTLLLAVTVGSVAAKKHKILAAVGVYYGIQVVISIAGVSGMTSVVTDGSAFMAGVSRFLDSTAVLMLLISVVSYLLMYWLVDRKLNLN